MDYHQSKPLLKVYVFLDLMCRMPALIIMLSKYRKELPPRKPKDVFLSLEFRAYN